MARNRTEGQIRALLKTLLDPADGMGLNLFRLTIGTSDFSDGRTVSSHPRGFYSYQDTPDAEFSIQLDIDLGVIAMVKRVQEVAARLNPAREIKFFASCWSPPGWMKTSGSLIGGTLKAGFEKPLASYFRHYIEAYAAFGIPIYAITIQNEPNYLPTEYPGMRLSSRQEHDIVVAVWEEFDQGLAGKRELLTRLWINDHNFEDWCNADTTLTRLGDSGRKHYVDATAFHNYSAAPGDPHGPAA